MFSEAIPLQNCVYTIAQAFTMNVILSDERRFFAKRISFNFFIADLRNFIQLIY